MGLSALPTEIIYMIARETIPESYVPLLLTCKTVHAASDALREEYRLASRFRHFSLRRNNESSGGWPIESLRQLIYEIALEPRVATAIELADLRKEVFDELDEDNPEPSGEPVIVSEWLNEGRRAAIRELFKRNPFVQSLELSDEEESGWLKAILPDRIETDEGNRKSDLVTAFLLTLLPNLKRLAIDASRSEFVELAPADEKRTYYAVMETVFDRLKSVAHETGGEAKPLSQLKEIMPSWGSGTETKLGLCEFQWLLSLPSVEVFTQGSCVALDDGYTGTPLELQVREFPGIRQLELKDSVLGADEVFELTSRMPRLEMFKMEFGVKWHGCGYAIMDFDHFVRNLGRAVGSTLRQLSLTADNLYEALRGAKSIDYFEKLEDIELDYGIMLAHSNDKEDEDGNPLPQFEDERLEFNKAIVKAMPMSTRRLRICFGSESSSLSRHVNGDENYGPELRFDEAASVLPNLEVIEVLGAAEDAEWVAALPRNQTKPVIKLLSKPGFNIVTDAEAPPSWFELDDD